MERDELMKLTKEVLVTKLLELENTDVATAIAERDAAYGQQGEQATRITDLEVEKNQQGEELNAVKEELESLQAKLAEVDTDAEKAEMQRQLNDLSDRLAATEATKGDPRPIVQVNGKHRIIVAQRVRLSDGSVITAKELMNRPDLLKQFDESGSGVLGDLPVKK